MSAHTPGPWSLHGEYATKYVYARGENISGVVAVINCDWPGLEQKAEQQANARLIAAAPDLLDALKDALKCFLADHWDNHPTANEWRAVIAKATGEKA